jgi:F-type H+-transporting ATPase subunit b
MDGFLSVSPGVVIWTLINFTLFALLLAKFGWKPLLGALHEREHSIQDALNRAEEANAKAEKLLKENEAQMAKSQQEVMELLRDGRAQAQAQIQKAMADAEQVKQAKLNEATAEIQREKDVAMQSLRDEVSNLVLMATEKILKEKMDAAQQKKVVDAFIQEIRKN